jgi:GTP-binding protein
MTEAFWDIEFAFGAAKFEQLPPEVGVEVAFAGRSNAGKSTAINTICNRKRLAFVSKTPGRTQQLNFFRVPEVGFLVDLPGYGYAKVAGTMKSTWGRLIGDYIMQRRSLRGVIIMMDCRHPFTDLDLQLLQWMEQIPRPIHILLTKSDKLNRQQGNKVLADAEKLLATRPGTYSVQLFSGTSKYGVEEARGVVRAWLLGQDSNEISDGGAP